MEKLDLFFEKMKQKYGDEVVIKKRDNPVEVSEQVPQPLRYFYSNYAEASFPFGYIDTLTDAAAHSEAQPFKNEGWFCFGFDGIFSFFLCGYEPDGEGMWFTYWDHDSGSEIGEPFLASLEELLEEIESEHEEYDI